MAIVTVHNSEEFEREVLQASKLVLVDFWASWCGPCKLVAPEVEAVAEKMADTLKVVRVDVDECKELALIHGVQGVPTMVFFQHGEEKDRIAGYRPAAAIEAALKTVK